MKPELLEELVCPACSSPVTLRAGAERGAEILSGTLACTGCRRSYSIRDGIPRMLPEPLRATDARIAAAFAYEWSRFPVRYEQARNHFLEWIAPLSPQDFAGKRVVDAGCGMGRHAREAARFGAAAVFALDLSEAVDVARRYAGEEERVHFIQGDLRRPPLRGSIDLIYSIGVLNQIPDPEAGFAALARLLRPGGLLFAWVYAAEAGGWITKVVDPVRRRVTSRLPFPLLRALTWLPAAMLVALGRAVYRPAARVPWLRARLPGFSYLHQLSSFPFSLVHCTVFDHLVAPAARYCNREEFESLFRVAGLIPESIQLRHGSGWRGLGRKPAT